VCGCLGRSAQTHLLDSANAPHERLGIGDSDSVDFWNPTGPDACLGRTARVIVPRCSAQRPFSRSSESSLQTTQIQGFSPGRLLEPFELEGECVSPMKSHGQDLPMGVKRWDGTGTYFMASTWAHQRFWIAFQSTPLQD